MAELLLSLPTWLLCGFAMVYTAVVGFVVYVVSNKLISKQKSYELKVPNRISDIDAILIGVLNSNRVGTDIVVEACNLVITDHLFNNWVGSMKYPYPPSEKPLSIDCCELLKEYEPILNAVTEAWKKFESAKLSPDQLDVWQQNDNEFLSALRHARKSLNRLGSNFGRKSSMANKSLESDA